MRKSCLLSFILLCSFLTICAQQNIRFARQQSWQSLVYRVPADSAEKYIKNQSPNIDVYANQSPFAIWNNKVELFELLPPGNYLIVSVEKNELVAKYYCKSNVIVKPVNDRRRLQFELRDSAGNADIHADVWLNNNKLKFNPDTKAYASRKRNVDEAIVKIISGSDTSFFELTEMEHYTKTYWRQWWTNLYHRKPIYTIATPVRFVKRLVTTKPVYWFERRRYYRKSEDGYMIFNQPKYKPGDTLRLKAYIVNRKGKPIKKQLNLFLNYYSKGNYSSKQLTNLSPVSPGAYVYDFALGDSLDADINYQLLFRDSKEHEVISGGFKIEDYLLDEVATYSLRSEKEKYYKRDTLVFYVNAKDANGLALMDGRVKLYLTTKNITAFYNQQEIVPDTLWQKEKVLLVEGDTKFEVPASALPFVDIDIHVKAEFRNSNNEIQEKETKIKIIKDSFLIKAEQQGGYIVADYLENGISVPARGKLSYGDEKVEREISFPFKEKINPFAEEYELWIEDTSGKLLAYESLDIEKTGDVIFNRVQIKDSVGFSLFNPMGANVHYSVLYGNQIIAAGSDTAENIFWVSKLPSKKIYTAVWNYYWGGKEYKGNNSVALLSNLLSTNIKGAENIYPGQTDTITVNVKDYKGKPANDVNLTAVSYNSQFSKDIKVPEPPYRQRYKYRSRILMEEYEMEPVEFTAENILGEHQQWRNIFGLDTMLYYRFLFPEGGKLSSAQLIHDYFPQLSVHIVKKGQPQEIYLLYINREMVWYNGVTDKSNYAFTTPPGYVKIGFRLKDKYIEMDSVYVQPYYKHDMVFDLDQLPVNAKVYERNGYYSSAELLQLQKQLFRISDDPKVNGGYIWQNDRLVKLAFSKPHIVGPFTQGDSIQFFKPGAFDLKFAFEPQYEYTLTPKMARLEKKPLFEQKAPVKIPAVVKTQWILGDTVSVIPSIDYTESHTPLFLRTNEYLFTQNRGMGKILLQLPKDSIFSYAVLYSTVSDTDILRIKDNDIKRFENVLPGNYNLILVTSGHYFLEFDNIQIKANATTCLKSNKPHYLSKSDYIDILRMNQMNKIFKGTTGSLPADIDSSYTPTIVGIPFPYGDASFTGTIIDSKGHEPIAGAVVRIKGYNSGIVSDAKGYFEFRNIQQGTYTIIISTVGYTTKALQVQFDNNIIKSAKIELEPAVNALSEVVVAALGIQRKSNLTASISVVRGAPFTQMLQGQVAGVQVDGSVGNASSVVIRGASSLAGNTKPFYVVNGIVMEELPAGMEIDKMKVDVLKGEMAINLYGARAANGVIIINTPDFSPKSIRENFKDYAIWQPNLITDKEGKVKFVTTYPDNITSWQTFVIGMDKKKRITKTSTLVKSFKPMLAQIALPQFLIEGDSATAIGKLINYTTSAVEAKSDFSVNDSIAQVNMLQLRAKESVNERLNLIGKGDTLKVQYNLKLNNGYADGELRKIPVYKKGTEEARGFFSIINADTSFSFTPDSQGGNTVISIQDNPLDVLLDEMKYLKDYPYFCMEQTASKLTGLLLEKQVLKTLQQPFKEEKEISRLLSKLQKAQLFNGGWAWWQNGEANLFITNYITRALLPLKDDALVQTNLRNATLFLQNILPQLKKGELLDALYTLSEADHIMDYSAYLQKIFFDSLTTHQQWLVTAIKQKQQLSYAKEWQVLMSKKIETMFGGIHWGDDSYWWQHNEIATTVLAYKIIQRKEGEENILQKIIQYFLERRKSGRWRNTVESASICAAILPKVMELYPKFSTKPIVTIKANETITANKFPFVTSINDTSIPINITKRGGGMMYVTAWQKIFNSSPQSVTNNFIINTVFEKNNDPITVLKAGEKATMKITVNALKDAEYVLVEIPIPAGCTYAEKPQSWSNHKEFLKDKVVIFVEQMPKGKYEYSIELEPRYSGKYHLNPAKAELMYFATFYGRNEMKSVEIAP